MEKLGEHLQWEVISRLDWTSMARAAAVCRLWRVMVNTDLFMASHVPGRSPPASRIRDMHAAQASDIDAQPVWKTNMAACNRHSEKSTAFIGLVVCPLPVVLFRGFCLLAKAPLAHCLAGEWRQ